MGTQFGPRRNGILRIIFKAPRFDKNGMVTSLLWLLFWLMGVLVQNNWSLKVPTDNIGISKL